MITLHLRARRTVGALLLQGITPERLALSLALGVVVGVVPVVGAVALLATVVAVLLRLNLVAVHLVTWAAYPFQFLLLVPFMRLGEALLGAGDVSASVAGLVSAAGQGFWPAAVALWQASARALVAWAMTAPAAGLVLYGVFLWLLRRMWRKQPAALAPAHVREV